MKIFPTRWTYTKTDPSDNASGFWGAFSLGVFGCLILTIFSSPVAYLVALWLAVVFPLPEAYGVFVKRGWTYSEWMWWHMPLPWVRFLWSMTVALLFAIHIQPLIGGVLFIWLIPHVTMRGRITP